MMPKPGAVVWISEANAFDYTPAEVYGELRVLHAQGFAAGAIDDSYNRGIVASLRKQLDDYTPMRDFLLLTGGQTRISVVSMLVAERGKKHQILQWDKINYRYVPYTVNLDKP